MPNHFSSLRFRLVLLVLVAVIPVFGLILHSAARHRELMSNQVTQNAMGAARAVATEQNRLLDNAHQFLITLARVPQIRDNDKAACHKVLAGLLEPLYIDLSVTDLKGRVLCNALKPAQSVNNPKGRHHRQTIETQSFSVGDIRRHPLTGQMILDLGFPMTDSSGLLHSVVSAAVDFTWVTRLTVYNRLYPGATFTLVDASGTVLLRYPNGDDWQGKQIFSPAQVKPTVGGEPALTIQLLALDGVQRLFALSQLRNQIGGQTVYAAIDIPAAEAFAEANRILALDLILMALLAVIVLSAAWFGSEFFILRRIRDIITTTKKVAVGVLGARTTPPYESNELGQMARAFDDLVDALEKRQAEARQSTKQIQEQRQQQQALYDLNLGITSTLDLGDVLKIFMDHTSVLFPFCTVTLNWLDKSTGNLQLVAHRSVDDSEQMQADLAVAQSLPLLVLKQQSPLATSLDHIDSDASERELFRRYNLLSYLGLPLIAKGEILGVLSFYSRTEREFSSEQVNFLNALVNEAAIAIFNSRLYEQTREQAVELEKSNKIKDEFLGVMSHELRTPLNIIMNYAEVLRMGALGVVTEEQMKGTDKIRSQAGHLLTLINGILEITKIESGTVALQSEFVSLTDFMSDCQSDYMSPMDKDLQLKWDFPADLPVIRSDRMRLRQVLTNLVNNAIKFTEQGTVNVAARTRDDGETFELRVADTGPGIPEDRLERIFDKFHQIDSATTRNFAGAGLGLYIVKTFVDLLDGSISVESKIGAGTIFTVRLPIKMERGAAPVHDSAAARPGYVN